MNSAGVYLIVCHLLLVAHTLNGSDIQFNLYHTDWIGENTLYFDCLHYIARDARVFYGEEFRRSYQIIPYCIRPTANEMTFWMTMLSSLDADKNSLSKLTFKNMKNERITIDSLSKWSASIDLLERYRSFLDNNNGSFTDESSQEFFNCSLPWFGPYCQYSFHSLAYSDEFPAFDSVVHSIFSAYLLAKSRRGDWEIENEVELVCYTYLNCNRGPPGVCLDWREVCDGKVDCMEDGVDEKSCSILESSECKADEYRCHNGLCIPVSLFGDDPTNPDCLDATDENDESYEHQCHLDPAFRCEESAKSLSRFSIKQRPFQFVCGDGQWSGARLETDFIPFEQSRYGTCKNGRGSVLTRKLYQKTTLPKPCFSNLYCRIVSQYNCWQLPSAPDLTKICPIIFDFPEYPVTESHVRFYYLSNQTITPWNSDPTYICYDPLRCPNVSSTLIIGNWSCLYRHQFSSSLQDDVDRFFHASCLTGVDNEISNVTHCQTASLFHCPGTTKCISKYRIMDGIADCLGATDEHVNNSCELVNDKHRFRCTSENKCIPNWLRQDGIQHCAGGEDEIQTQATALLTFPQLCNGHPLFSSILISTTGEQETDETNCLEWPCNRQYTNCDGVWDCVNGEDELDCPNSGCFHDHHACVSIDARNMTCLHVSKVNDGNIDCIGSSDERKHCRQVKPTALGQRFKCSESPYCNSAADVCSNTMINDGEGCGGLDSFICLANINHFNSLTDVLPESRRDGHFFLKFSNNYPTTIPIKNWTMKETEKIYWLSDYSYSSEPLPIINLSYEPLETSYLLNEGKFKRFWFCNRGIPIRIRRKDASAYLLYCLCPPSYFGVRCQYQSQRVSVTLQFRRSSSLRRDQVFGIFATLIDHFNVVHSLEEFIYVPTRDCGTKFNFYLFYNSRPKIASSNYSVQIDVRNKMTLASHATWLLPVNFAFLPVNRLVGHLQIPSQPDIAKISSDCNPSTCVHGQCMKYVNVEKSFCRCDSQWSGPTCEIPIHDCRQCSADAICVDSGKSHKVGCICPLQKYGPRCVLHSICSSSSCKNGGTCVPEDQRVSLSSFTCLCQEGYSGANCELLDTKIILSFGEDMNIPQAILCHFITTRQQKEPMPHRAIFRKIPDDQNTVTLYSFGNPFHILLIELIQTKQYYLAVVQEEHRYSTTISTSIAQSRHCPHIQNLIKNETLLAYPVLRRAKYYHKICSDHHNLACFHDNELFMCLCDRLHHANCFRFDFNRSQSCKEWNECENGAQCVQDHPTCPSVSLCLCPECFYGTKCQFTTNGIGLSLDAILGYQIRRRVNVFHQSTPVKISIIISTIIVVIGGINAIVSILTFQSVDVRQIGCGVYLLTSSVVSFIIMPILLLKFWFLVLSHSIMLTNRTLLLINCLSIDFLLRSLLAINDWLEACVAIERVVTIKKGIHFDKKKSKEVAKWIIISIFMFTTASLVHDPIHRMLMYDNDEERIWCLLRYSSFILEIFNTIANIVHFIVPFGINLICSIYIIVLTARRRSISKVSGQSLSYMKHLKKELDQHKHLLISSLILVILALPRLIISLVSGCMKSSRSPWLFLFGYFLSFIPVLLTFVVFVLPSKVYCEEFHTTKKRLWTTVRRRFCQK